MKIEDVPLDKITIKDRFREEAGDVSDIVVAIKEKGFISPIILDTDKNLIAGFRRLVAAKEVGLKSVPAVIHSVSGELDAREIELIENVVRKDFKWYERAKLEKRIMELKKKQNPKWTIEDQSKYLGQSFGSSQRRLVLADMLDIVPELSESRNEDDAWKKYKVLEEEVVVASLRGKSDDRYKKAIKYASDHYRIGDALEGLRGVQDGIAAFTEVDPPYGVDLHKRKSRSKIDMDNYNEIEASEYPEFISKVATEVYRVMADNTFCVWWYGPQWYAQVSIQLIKAGFKVSQIPAIWTKGVSGQTASPDTMLGSTYEPFLVLRKGNPKLAKPGRGNEFRFDPIAPQNKIHPTERPLDLMVEIMRTFAFPGTAICVPFLGSGVSLRAAYVHGCTGFGWELDDYCKERFLNAVQKDRMKEDSV